ncbi:MAG: recombinase family protein [Lysobacter sp.]
MNTHSPQDALRVAAYCRADAPDSDLIAFQKTVIRTTLARCADEPPQITVYADDGIYPRESVRPDLQRLLRDVVARRIDCVAVCGWENLADTQTELRLLRRFFRDHEVLVMECRLPPAYLVRIPM